MTWLIEVAPQLHILALEQLAHRRQTLFHEVAQIDRLADALAAWAAMPDIKRPDDAVDVVISDVARRITELGVPEQERPRPGSRGRG